MAQSIPPIPTTSAIVQLDDKGKPLAGFPLGSDFYLWLFALANLVQSSGKLVGTALALTGQKAAIGTTPLVLPALTAGFYRVSFYARVTTPAGVTSTLGGFTLTWTDGGVSIPATLAAGDAGNLNTTFIQGSALVRIDAASAIDYAMGYASNPASAMVYSLGVTVEQVA